MIHHHLDTCTLFWVIIHYHFRVLYSLPFLPSNKNGSLQILHLIFWIDWNWNVNGVDNDETKLLFLYILENESNIDKTRAFKSHHHHPHAPNIVFQYNKLKLLVHVHCYRMDGLGNKYHHTYMCLFPSQSYHATFGTQTYRCTTRGTSW